jgi:hypothetical protein
MKIPVTRMGNYLALVLVAMDITSAQPVAVRHVQGYSRGFIVLKDLNDRVLASGGMVQRASGNRVASIFTLRFKDGSQYEETSEFSQQKTYQLLRYKQVQKGPAFPTQKVVEVDTASGHVKIQHTAEDGKLKTIEDKLALPQDLANGIITTLLTEADPIDERTLSMLVATPKPRIVKLKIVPSSKPETFSIGGAGASATHYVLNIDLGGVTGTVAKVIGKQPPPIHVWIASGNGPVFLKSEGPLFEDGPIWRIEQAGPTWPKKRAAQ